MFLCRVNIYILILNFVCMTCILSVVHLQLQICLLSMSNIEIEGSRGCFQSALNCLDVTQKPYQLPHYHDHVTAIVVLSLLTVCVVSAVNYIHNTKEIDAEY